MPPSGKELEGTCFRPPKMGQSSHHHAKFGEVGTLHAAIGAKSLMFFCSSLFWKDRVCERHITMKELELRNKFGTVG